MKHTEFYPTFGPLPQYVRKGVPQGWRIGFGGFKSLDSKKSNIVFAREIDCKLAIHALTEAGVTTLEQIMALSDEDLTRITMSGLQW